MELPVCSKLENNSNDSLNIWPIDLIIITFDYYYVYGLADCDI